MNSESRRHQPADDGAPSGPHAVTDPDRFNTILGEAPDFVRNKLGDRLDDPTKAFIALSPLIFVATSDRQGRLDVSPKGDAPGFVHTVDTNTLLVRPGGRLHLRESHPMAMTLDDEREDDLLCVKYPYFETEAPMTFDQNETYVDTGGATVEHGVTHEWNHGIGEVFTALTNAGLVVTTLEEHRHLDWRFLPQQVEVDELFYMPEHQRDLVPWQYTMQATKS